MEKNINVIVPTIPADVAVILNNKDLYLKNLSINEIYLIGTIGLENCVKNVSNLNFLNENLILSYEAVENCIKKRTLDSKALSRTGWYLQQFLKMAYARLCTEDYYLLWDSDTVPLKKNDLFNSLGNPFLDYKTECNKAYFDTLSKILPGYKKVFAGSFIAEHMLVNTKIMRQLLDKIESNKSIPGTFFYEKIINAISLTDLTESGFSEFETYGTFVQVEYPNYYELRKWKSLRFGGFFISITNLDEDFVKWMSKYYNAITLEKHHKLSPIHVIVKCKIIRELLPSSILEYLAIPIRIRRKIFIKINNIKKIFHKN